MYPSTCGLMLAECRDFSTDRYSLVSGMLCASAILICTSMACGAAAACGWLEPLPHPPAAIAALISASATRLRLTVLLLITCKQNIVAPHFVWHSPKVREQLSQNFRTPTLIRRPPDNCVTSRK